jgi:SAM-dependent methyltransferase
MKNFVRDKLKGKRFRVRLEHADEFFPGGPENTKGSGLRWIYRLARHFCKGKGLDVGPCGVTADGKEYLAYPNAVRVDIRLPGTGSATDLSKHDDESMDYVFSSHCLEHVDDPELAMSEFWRVLKPGGVLFLYLPIPGHASWDPDVNKGVQHEHWWQPTPDTLGRIMLLAGFKIEYLEREEDHMSSFVAIGRKRVNE